MRSGTTFNFYGHVHACPWLELQLGADGWHFNPPPLSGKLRTQEGGTRHHRELVESFLKNGQNGFLRFFNIMQSIEKGIAQKKM